MNRIETNRRNLDGRAAIRRWSSPAIYGLDTTLTRALEEHGRGAVLDAGCGSMPYRAVIERSAVRYDGLDIEPRTAGVRYTCSVTDMAPVSDASYDTVLCSEVLEHLRDPAAALSEINRVLKPGGKLILSVPFLGRLHEEPHDYFRFTKHGLTSLLSAAELKPFSLSTTGSVAGFLGHQVSTVLVGATWHIPILGWIAYGFNAAFVVLPSLLADRLLGPLREKLPLGYVVVAAKA